MKIGIIGCGHMGTALIAGLRTSGTTDIIAVVESSEERRKEVAQRYEAQDCGNDIGALCRLSDVVVLAMKPADLSEPAAELRKHLTVEHVVISLLAGVTRERLAHELGSSQVVRFMPSLAAAVGKALVGVSLPDDAANGVRDTAEQVAAAIGTPLFVAEKLMSAVTGLSGSGIAFVFEFVHALCLGAVQSGMRYDDALRGAVVVLEGAAETLKQTNEHPVSLLSKVISPAGTTVAGVEKLHSHGFDAAVMAAVVAAADKAQEFER